MAASSLHDLLDFEVHFEGAAATFLNTATSIDVFTTVNATDLVAPRLEVQFVADQSDPVTSLRGGGASPNTKDFVDLNATFNVRVVTDNAAGGASDHATYRSKVRAELLYSGANWGSSNLPYYDLKWLQPGGCSYLTDADFNISELSWNVRFAIRDDAWPS
jgi:hypothetical protein